MLLSGSDLSVELNGDSLINDKFCQVTVDAQTEVGFNGSLHLQSVILPSKATGTDAVLQCNVTILLILFDV